jgi:hypothetical protein
MPSLCCKPKIKVKKGANMAKEISEKNAERMFRIKYPVTILGYFLI